MAFSQVMDEILLNDNIFHVEDAMANWSISPKMAGKERLLSPLGWSVGVRLIWAAGASALLWLAVAWALG
jgi:hypothetical protein